MNASLIETARANRILALEYLQAKKATAMSDGDVLCLSTMRKKLRQTPVFLTRRMHSLDENLAA